MNPWAIIGALLVAGSLGGWALLERAEVYRKDRELGFETIRADVATDAAIRNDRAAKAWAKAYDKQVEEAETLRNARDAASERAADAEDAASDAARDAETKVVVYVQDLALVRMPCGLVRVLDAAADDSADAGTPDRRARLSASAGCADKADQDLSRLGFDALVSAFLWVAEDRRAAKARAAGLSDWFASYWRTEKVVTP